MVSKELNKTKEDTERLGQQLIEAIQQKLELSEQLEQWQVSTMIERWHSDQLEQWQVSTMIERWDTQIS